MKVIATNRNKKDFQSMTFETDLTWEELKEAFINRKDITKYIYNGTMFGIGDSYPRATKQKVLINDSIHFSIKYGDITNEPLKNYWIITELFLVDR